MKVSKGEVKVIKLTSQGHMAAPNWSLQKAWHASLGDTWHTPHATRVPKSRKRKLQNLTPSPALLLITQTYLYISQMSFITYQNPKYALNRAKSYFCENSANKAINDRLRTHINNISHKHSSHIII